MSWEAWGAVAAAVAVGALVQGTIGFGFVLISAPVLVQFEPGAVPVTLLLLALPLNLTVLWRERTALDARGAAQVLAGMVVGTAIAVVALRLVPEERLAILFGVAIVLGGVAVAVRAPARVGSLGRSVAGVASGAINTVTGTGGPLVALVYVHRGGAVLRSTLAAVFAVSVVLSVGGQALASRLTWDAVLLAAGLLPALLVGMAGSRPARAVLSEAVLRRGVIALVVVGGLAAIARGL